jgi:hypothetical protein
LRLGLYSHPLDVTKPALVEGVNGCLERDPVAAIKPGRKNGGLNPVYCSERLFNSLDFVVAQTGAALYEGRAFPLGHARDCFQRRESEVKAVKFLPQPVWGANIYHSTSDAVVFL